MLYELARPLLFKLDPETAHELAIASLRNFAGLMPGGARTEHPVQVMGLTFPNRIGMAAGLDKNGEAIDGFAKLGFGFLEIGTVTPHPQPGNPKPRLFRLPEANAIINRMGFNNEGVDALLENVRKVRYTGILGINIGKNFDTPIEQAFDDYRICFEKVYPHANYVTVNVSSPNTQNLRQLQGSSELDDLLGRLKAEQTHLTDLHGKYVPLVLKIAPDLDDAQIGDIAQTLLRHRIDGVIATNTTISRDKIKGLPDAEEQGGLSGAPLLEASTAVVARLAATLRGEIPIIASGGVMDTLSTRAKLEAGATLVQLYSGLIYRGPGLVAECIKASVPLPS